MTLIQTIAGTAGGLAFFILGLRLVTRTGLEIYGRQLEAMLYIHTSNRFKAVLGGIPFALALPSWPAAWALAGGMGHAGLLTTRQAVGIILGMPIGAALVMEAIAFEPGNWAVFVVVAGAALAPLVRHERLSMSGKILLGAGLVLFGISQMRIGADAAMDAPALDGARIVAAKLATNPFYLFVAGIVIAAALLSPVTAMALVFAFAPNAAAAIPLCLGASVGACAANWLYGLHAGRFGRRATLAHVLTKLFGASLFMLILGRFTAAMEFWNARIGITSPPHVAANANLIYALLNALIFLPLVPVVEQLVFSLAGEREEPSLPPVRSCDLENAPLGIEKARLQTGRMGRGVLAMLRKNLSAFLVDEPSVRAELPLAYQAVDLSVAGVCELLRRVDQSRLSHRELGMRNRLSCVARDIKAVADLVAGPLSLAARMKSRAALDFSVETAQQFERFHRLVADGFAEALDLLEGLPATADRVLTDAAKVEALRQNLVASVAGSASQNPAADAEIDRIFHEAIASLRSIHYYACDMTALLTGPSRAS